jgi:hypothetical protein
VYSALQYKYGKSNPKKKMKTLLEELVLAAYEVSNSQYLMVKFSRKTPSSGFHVNFAITALGPLVSHHHCGHPIP